MKIQIQTSVESGRTNMFATDDKGGCLEFFKNSFKLSNNNLPYLTLKLRVTHTEI